MGLEAGVCVASFTDVVHTGITQLVLPALTRFIPARAERDLEHYIRNALLNVAHLPTSEGWEPESSYLTGSGVEPLNMRE